MRRLEVGDVVAIAVHGLPYPPVGTVVDLDDNGLTLRQYQFQHGSFTGQELQIYRRDIRMTIWAEPMEPAPAYCAEEGVVIFNMDPLADFQSAWKLRQQ